MGTPSPWDQFVTDEPPTFYVATRSRSQWHEEDRFWKSAAPLVRCLRDRAPLLERQRLAIALGAGVGRLTVPLGRWFRRVKVIDHSSVLSHRLRDTCQRFGVCNVETMHVSDSWHEEPADLMCSILLFPRIRALQAIAEYVEKIARCLQGTAFLHFDTTPKTRMEKFAAHLPARLSPRVPSRPEQRFAHDATALRTLFLQHRLQVDAELHPNGPMHVFVLSPASQQ